MPVVQMPEKVLFFPLSIILNTSKIVCYFDADTENLFYSNKNCSSFRECFLKSINEGFCCDEDINMMTKYLTTKIRLQQCKTDNKKLTEELDQLKKIYKKAEYKANKGKQLIKQHGKANCCICQDKFLLCQLLGIQDFT